MKPSELNRSIARVTGESLITIQRLGFELISREDSESVETESRLPQFIDWDEEEGRDWLTEFEQAMSVPAYV
ncbi:MAG TPA: hypothetical protein DD473_09845 [Planctomycetaceae bacterium]|nr:hypothetical protein [Planctomycetaceae bacterium]|tara:strand:- start:80 stop:295 length:216 start_codon:yes stop_codon:yes gene_type:complete